MEYLAISQPDPSELTLEIPASVKYFETIYSVVSSFIYEHYFVKSDFKSSLVIRELLVNAITHGCHNDERQHVLLTLKDIGNKKMSITVRDKGKGFPYQKVKLDLPSKIQNGSSRGLRLVNSLAGKLHFHGCGNHVEAIISLS